MQINHNALYDGLSIASKLDGFLDAFRLNEIHLFSYFSSILFLYEGNTTADWNYKYIINEAFPFSDTLEQTLDRNINNGWFEKSGDFFRISARGSDELNKFMRLDVFKVREKYLDAACTTTVLMPYQDTIRALINEPNFINASTLQNNQWLKHNLVSTQFKELSEQLGVPSGDLIIPSVSWIQHLLQEAERKK